MAEMTTEEKIKKDITRRIATRRLNWQEWCFLKRRGIAEIFTVI